MPSDSSAGKPSTTIVSPQHAALLSAIVQSSDDAILSKRLDGTITSWNPAAERMFGYTAAEIVGRSVLTLIPEDRHGEEAEIIGRIGSGQRVEHFETLRRTKSGELIPVALTISPVRDADGRVIGASKIARDISERVRSDRLLKSQNAALELVASGAPLGEVLEFLAGVVREQVGSGAAAVIFLVSSDGTRLRIGAAPDLPGTLVGRLDGIEIDACGCTCASAAHVAAECAKELRHTLDEPLPVRAAWEAGFRSSWSLPILSADRRVLGTVGTYLRETRLPTQRDREVIESLCRTAAIAIQHRVIEDAARRDRHRVEMVVHSANVGVWYCPLPFDRLVWDRKVKEHFHLPPDADVTIDTFYEHIHPDDRERTRAAIARSIEDQQPYETEYRTVSGDGRHVKWIHAIGRGYYDDAGRPTRFDGITLDVTSRVQTELSLRESEERFRTLADNISQLAWMTDERGAIFWYNRRWFTYTGTSPDEMEGELWRKVIHPDHVEAAAEKFYRYIASGEVWEDTLLLRGADGTYRWFLSRAVPIHDETGKVIRWFGTNTDIDEQRRGAELLRRHVETLDTLNKTNLALASPGDTEGIVQAVTDAATRLTKAAFGAFFYNVINEHGESYTLYTISGAPRSAFEKFPMPRNTEVFGPTFDGEGVVRSDDITKDPRYGRNAPYKGMPEGHLPVRSYLAVPVMSRSGGVIGGLFFGHPEAGVFDDEAERYALGIAAQAAIAIDNARLYETLRRREERYELAARATNDAIWDWDLATGRVGWNRAIAERFGHEDALSGTTAEWWMQHIHPQDRDRVLTSIHAAIDDPGQKSWQDEYQFQRADGTWADVLDRGTVLRTESGRPVRMVGAMLDVSERKRGEQERQALLESERAARASAERAGRLKDEFLATLSHELRTPLNAILGWTHILKSGETDSRTIEQGLDVIERNARVQTQLIADLLDMSRIITGKMRLDVQRVELPRIIEQAVDSIRPAADAKGLRIQSVLDPVLEPVHGDPARLQQIVWNLLSNAVKFTPKGGRVQVVLARVNSHVEISISDTGEGIRPEFLPHVFERFRQADATAARKHGGLGIGLALVRQLVELHGGRVRAASDGEGKGATFIVELPLAILAGDDHAGRVHPRAVSGSPAAMGVPRLSGLRILVVDDEPDSLEMVKRVLESYDAEVVTAVSARDALQFLDQASFDAVLSDVGMPDIDGYDFIAQLRKQGNKVPAAALTAFARSEDRTRALLAGYQSHVIKPVEPAELLATLLSITNRTML